MQPPTELTRLEWEREVREFEEHLTPQQRALLPSVRLRQEPLAKLATAQPLADQLKMRFAPEMGGGIKQAESKSETAKRLAVSERRFGFATRDKFTWHPSKLLCKYFNQEDPYPGSQMVGTLELQKRISNTTSAAASCALGGLGLPNTQRDLLGRIEQEARQHRITRVQDGATSGETRFDPDSRDAKFKQHAEFVDKPEILPPIALLSSVFEDAAVDSSSSEDEKEEEPPTKRPLTFDRIRYD